MCYSTCYQASEMQENPASLSTPCTQVKHSAVYHDSLSPVYEGKPRYGDDTLISQGGMIMRDIAPTTRTQPIVYVRLPNVSSVRSRRIRRILDWLTKLLGCIARDMHCRTLHESHGGEWVLLAFSIGV